MKFFGDKAGVNYEFCVRNNRPRVKQMLEVMEKIRAGLSLRELLSLLLAFVQEIGYGKPPFSEGNKIIWEFWVPPRVLVQNLGDCDSKAATFASVWTGLRKYPLLFVKIPNHLFLGVAIPLLGVHMVTINGLRYTLLEVTGPGKMPPGLITPYSQFYLESGQLIYEIVK